jgi:hypothetical protein
MFTAVDSLRTPASIRIGDHSGNGLGKKARQAFRIAQAVRRLIITPFEYSVTSPGKNSPPA